MKTFPLLTTLALLISQALGANYDDHHFLLDQSLSKEQTDQSPYLFSDVREVLTAINHLQYPYSDTITLDIAPGVYWVDDPDDPEMRRGNNTGSAIPYGFKVQGPNLRLNGLCTDAQDVVLACNRGQMQGALGNFTMLRLDCPTIEARNITFGNYCSVDLVYPRDPSKNRPRRSPVITQAQLIHTSAKFVEAVNCRFISRLNLCPFHGVGRALFTECHFECTDDALEGAAIYNKCHLDFYSNKPFWATPDCGPVFLDCQIDCHVADAIQYFIKTNGPLTLIRTELRQVDGKDLVVLPCFGPNDAPCYYSDVTLNGKPLHIPGAIDITDMRVYGGLSSIDNLLHGPYPTYIKIIPVGGDVIKENEDSKTLQFKYYCWNGELADQRLSANLLVTAALPAGIRGHTRLTVDAHLRPAPQFTEMPTLKLNKAAGSLHLHYLLPTDTHETSQICWYRYKNADGSDAIPIHLEWEPTDKYYHLTPGDIGYRIKAVVTPKFLGSHVGEPTTAVFSDVIKANMVLEKGEESKYVTDFHDIPVMYQPIIQDGAWTFDSYKPLDTQTFFWTPVPERCWYYGLGVNGAADSLGLLQGTRGARCFYMPARKKCTDMEANISVIPAKNKGQGFGSATGQYMDIGIKFDPHTLTGYALRIQRSAKFDNQCAFFLVEYKNGKVTPLNEPQYSSCYRGNVEIAIAIKGSILTARIGNGNRQQDVTLAATGINNTNLKGFYIQHTGTTGPSASLIKQVKLSWK